MQTTAAEAEAAPAAAAIEAAAIEAAAIEAAAADMYVKSGHIPHGVDVTAWHRAGCCAEQS